MDHLVRVNAVVDHVLTHLDAQLRLDDLARVARFSPFHFHRKFRSITGETIAQFVKRVRLERAIVLLSSPERLDLTTIAIRCGFASSSAFSRAFRERYGQPPRRFDLAAHRDGHRASLDGGRLSRLDVGANPDGFTAVLEDIPERRIAYRRAFRPYSSDAVAVETERMLGWARERNLTGAAWLGIQWDDPEVVALDDCRYDVAVVVSPGLRIDDGVSEATLPPMLAAAVAIAGDVDLELRAIDWLYRTWLPLSGYLPAPPAMEAWDGDPAADADGRYRLRVTVPLVRLRR
ncbi:GyrI-like domain-containing protein [Lysobacter korlensis]|uniref:GyrI-like domain-containing protein n=1 Tax=Lysobacter korlensis TaxID=553636 RepID=A0ABV6RY30_9GAMM